MVLFVALHLVKKYREKRRGVAQADPVLAATSDVSER